MAHPRPNIDPAFVHNRKVLLLLMLKRDLIKRIGKVANKIMNVLALDLCCLQVEGITNDVPYTR